MKYILLLLTFLALLPSALTSAELTANSSLKASGLVVDLVYKNGFLYAGTDASAVDIFDIKKQKLIQTISLPQVKDFMGDISNAKVYSLDVLKSKVLITSQGEKGFRRIYIYEDNKLNLILGEKAKMFVAKAKYINEKQILISLLSNQMFLYDLENKKFLWETQVSHSKFSDFVLSEKKDFVIVADESGDLKQIDIKKGTIVKRYEGQNLDNVFQVAYKNHIIATAGQDRRCVVYNTNEDSSYYKKATFLIYSVALSPKAVLVAFADDEDNNISIFNRKTKEDLYRLKGTKTTLSKIIFINENELFTASDDEIINYWKLKEKK